MVVSGRGVAKCFDYFEFSPRCVVVVALYVDISRSFRYDVNYCDTNVAIVIFVIGWKA